MVFGKARRQKAVRLCLAQIRSSNLKFINSSSVVRRLRSAAPPYYIRDFSLWVSVRDAQCYSKDSTDHSVWSVSSLQQHIHPQSVRRLMWAQCYSFLRVYLFKLQKQPQCEKCSVVYPYMKNVLCGACMDGELQFRSYQILAQPDSVQVPASSARDGE